LNQQLISQELERTFTGDDVGSDSGTIENVYQGVGVYQCHRWGTVMMPADANGGGRYFMNHE